MGLANPPPSAFPKGNTSNAVADKSFAAGTENTAGGQLLFIATTPEAAIIPTEDRYEQTPTVVIPGGGSIVDSSFVQPGDTVAVRAGNGFSGTCEVLESSVASGDLTLILNVLSMRNASSGGTGGDYLYGGVLYGMSVSKIPPGYGQEKASPVTIGGVTNVVVSRNAAAIGGGNNWVAAAQGAIVGGSSNFISSVATDTFIGGGFRNTSQAVATATLGGNGNTIGAASPQSAIIGGQGNVINGASDAVVLGSRYAKATTPGSLVRAYGSFDETPGTAQDISGPVLLGQTTDGTPTALSDGTYIQIPHQHAYLFSFMVVAYRTDDYGFAAYKLEGLAYRVGGFFELLSVVKTVLYESDTDYDVEAIDYETVNLSVRVTGKAGHTIRWVCTSRFADVSGEVPTP